MVRGELAGVTCCATRVPSHQASHDVAVPAGKKVKESDVIELQTGGTGFAARDGEKVQSSRYAAVGIGSGRQDLRGQTRGPRSLGGLSIMN